MDKADKIKAIADHYGYSKQSMQTIEECAELIQAINKLHRKADICKSVDGKDYEEVEQAIKNLTEEAADTQIMLWQMIYLFGLDIQDVIDQKLDRQLKRIEVEKNGKSD